MGKWFQREDVDATRLDTLGRIGFYFPTAMWSPYRAVEFVCELQYLATSWAKTWRE